MKSLPDKTTSPVDKYDVAVTSEVVIRWSLPLIDMDCCGLRTGIAKDWYGSKDCHMSGCGLRRRIAENWCGLVRIGADWCVLVCRPEQTELQVTVRLTDSSHWPKICLARLRGTRISLIHFQQSVILIHLNTRRGRGGLVVRLLASRLAKSCSIPDGVATGFPHVGIVPDDAAGRPVFSGISRFSHLCISALLHTHLAPPSSALKSSMLTATQISSLFIWPNHVITANCAMLRRSQKTLPGNLHNWDVTLPWQTRLVPNFPRYEKSARIGGWEGEYSSPPPNSPTHPSPKTKSPSPPAATRLAEGGELFCPKWFRLLASHLGEQASIPGGVAPGFPHVGIVPDDAVGRRVSSEPSRFPRTFIPGWCSALARHFTRVSSRDLNFKSRPNLATHSINLIKLIN
ncbi:hypothetical protein PR048_033305 [Dryococelus australis]|uniref:Uncharacterized protein n=1 Tax=Dryococelus australis TaxID=614101 RepID=A0ABQ9G391_9NEOP|nr:hypothetical protein PR048_033305 [Dryococelus australis]